MDYDPPLPPFGHSAPTHDDVKPDRPGKKLGLWQIFCTVLLVLSILVNGVLLLTVIVMAALMTTTTSKISDSMVERTLVAGSRQKIATIRVEGIIDNRMSDWVSRQLEMAENDPAVRGVIIRIVSPGGGVAASDQIHYAISRYKERTKRPVLAFMQSVAASGGYYTAVACDTIMAEPTAITGSIGVLMSHLVVKELLEEKLGIQPVVIKSGQRKDWPSMFSETTEEQRQYLDDRIIRPAYERFVQLVAAGRKQTLSEAEVRALADGSIFTAPDAMSCKLIDRLGYFEQAVQVISEQAGVSYPTVIEYRERFSMLSFLEAEAKRRPSLDAELLEKLLIPQVMYLWDGRR